MRGTSINVFINCPFDTEFQPLFEAIVFTVYASGYRVRCSLEENDSGDIRLDRLVDLIRESRIGIHDLSRVDLSSTGNLPRFNMPFELGLWYGTKRFGNPSQQKKRTLILIKKNHKMPLYLSDLGGNDAQAHGSKTIAVIRAVRNFLRKSPQGKLIAGPDQINKLYRQFRKRLPGIAENLKLSMKETDSLRHFPDFQNIVSLFVEENEHELIV